MSNTINYISNANTFYDWVVATNAMFFENNAFATGRYVKNTGTLVLNDATQGLQVANGALIGGALTVSGTGSSAYVQNTLSVGGPVTLTNTSAPLVLTVSGNVSVTNVLSGNWNASPISVTFGGTGSTTQQGALNTLAGATTSGYYLRGSGTNVGMSAIQVADVPTLNQNTTGTANAATYVLGATQNNVTTMYGLATAPALVTVGTITTGTWSGSFGAVSGSNLTNLTAGNLTGTIPSTVLGASSLYIGTTAVPLNAASGSITSLAVNITGTASGLTNSSSANVQLNSLGIGTASSTVTGEIRASNNITAYYTSDIKFKENVKDIPNALGKVEFIGGQTFDWKDDYINERGGEDGYYVQKSDFGVIAQNVQTVFPVATRTKNDGTLVVDYEKLCALAFAAIKELKQEVEELKKKIQQ